MKALNGIKLKIAEYLLKRRYNGLERNREIKNINKCNSVLVIASQKEDLRGEELMRFISYLKRNNSEIFALLYDNSKELVNIQSTDIKVVGLSHLNQIFIPKESYLIELLEREFDILIDLTIKEDFPLKYIHAMSKAKFKVGASLNYKKQFGDLTIDVVKNESIPYLITQLKHYLSLINREEEHVA